MTIVPETRITEIRSSTKTVVKIEHIFADGNIYVFTVIFVDKHFQECTFNHCGTYTREMWKALSNVEALISETETKLASGFVLI